MGYSLGGHKELDTPEKLTLSYPPYLGCQLKTVGALTENKDRNTLLGLRSLITKNFLLSFVFKQWPC